MVKFVRDIYRVIAGQDDLGDSLSLDDHDTDARSVGARYSRGNVAIQDGAYVTSGDLESERKRLARHAFPVR